MEADGLKGETLMMTIDCGCGDEREEEEEDHRRYRSRTVLNATDNMGDVNQPSNLCSDTQKAW